MEPSPLRAQMNAVDYFGFAVASFCQHCTGVLVERAHKFEFRRGVWPTLGRELQFDFMISRNDSLVLVIHNHASGASYGPSIPTDIDDVIEIPRPQATFEVHDSLRKRFNVREDESLFVLPLTFVGEDISKMFASLPDDAKQSLAWQIEANISHHRRFLGLPAPATSGSPKRPKSNTVAGKALLQLEQAGNRFCTPEGGSRVINRLRRCGYAIESATEARKRGATVPAGQKGYRLLRTE